MQIVEIDGEPASPQDLHRVAVMNYGHFTSMQVREGRVRGFELHLDRLASSSAVLFGHALGRERIRVLIRHALGTRESASVKVNVFAKNGDLSARFARCFPASWSRFQIPTRQRLDRLGCYGPPPMSGTWPSTSTSPQWG